MNHPADACQLCGLPLPANPPELSGGVRVHRFCCDSCRQIFRMLHPESAAQEAVGKPGQGGSR